MKQELARRMATSLVLISALVVSGALLQADLVSFPAPAAIATASLAFLAAASYPRARPRRFAWLPVAMLCFAALLSIAVPAVTWLSLVRYAGMTDFSGFVIAGCFFADASLTKNLLLAMDETETLRASAVPA